MVKVKCLVCGEMLDRDGPDCIKVKRNRYAHRSCALEKGMEEFNEETAPPPRKATMVKCKYCGQDVDKTSEGAIKVTNRWAHRSCYDAASTAVHDEEDFYNYCSRLFGKEYEHLKTKKMAEKFLRENPAWNYGGMLKTMQWYYDIKKSPLEGANGSIGILPYVYQQAKKYYYELYLAEQSTARIEEQKPDKEIDITLPKFEKKKRKIKLLEFEEDDE